MTQDPHFQWRWSLNQAFRRAWKVTKTSTFFYHSWSRGNFSANFIFYFIIIAYKPGSLIKFVSLCKCNCWLHSKSLNCFIYFSLTLSIKAFLEFLYSKISQMSLALNHGLFSLSNSTVTGWFSGQTQEATSDKWQLRTVLALEKSVSHDARTLAYHRRNRMWLLWPDRRLCRILSPRGWRRFAAGILPLLSLFRASVWWVFGWGVAPGLLQALLSWLPL
jgi:hypothetical protein